MEMEEPVIDNGRQKAEAEIVDKPAGNLVIRIILGRTSEPIAHIALLTRQILIRGPNVDLIQLKRRHRLCFVN